MIDVGDDGHVADVMPLVHDLADLVHSEVHLGGEKESWYHVKLIPIELTVP